MGDIINVYNPGKYQHTLGEYSQVGNQTIAEKNNSTKQSMV